MAIDRRVFLVLLLAGCADTSPQGPLTAISPPPPPAPKPQAPAAPTPAPNTPVPPGELAFDTWLADFVAEQGAGVAVADGDAAGLARAIAAVKADYGEFKRLAVERSAVARARNAPERFVRMLWDGAG